MLAVAITSTNPTAPSSTQRIRCTPPTSCSWSVRARSVCVTRGLPVPPSASRPSRSTASIVAPGFIRAMAGNSMPRLPPASSDTGTQNAASEVGKPNSAGITPAMRYGSPSKIAVDPITPGSAPKNRVHVAKLRTI